MMVDEEALKAVKHLGGLLIAVKGVEWKFELPFSLDYRFMPVAELTDKDVLIFSDRLELSADLGEDITIHFSVIAQGVHNSGTGDIEMNFSEVTVQQVMARSADPLQRIELQNSSWLTPGEVVVKGYWLSWIRHSLSDAAELAIRH